MYGGSMSILALLDLIPRWLLAALLAASLAHSCVTTLQRDSARSDLKSEKLSRANETAARELAARKATDEVRKIEQDRVAKAQQIAVATAREKSAIRAALDTALADADSLRNAIELYAASGDRAPSDTSTKPGPDDRAATLGNLLATCTREAVEDAGIAEGLASQVRGLQSAYKSLTP